MEVIELIEEEPKSITEDKFDYQAADILYYDTKNRISIVYPTKRDSNFTLKPNGCVGFIPINEKYLLQIKPKVPILNIFKMLEYEYRLESFEFLQGIITINSIKDIYENLAIILSKRILERNRKGLYLDYVEKNEFLPFLRGRIDFISSFVSINRGSAYLRCKYEMQTSDLIENQILLWTLYRLQGFQFERSEVKSLVQLAYKELVNKVEVTDIRPQDCINRLYNRLNQDYKPIHLICRFFLEQSGPGSEIGEYNFLPFVLDMPILFESFIAEWLEQHIPTQYRLNKKYWASLDEEGNFAFQIDLVLTDSNEGNVIAILDTKYKRGKPEEGDIQQVIAYAARMRTNKAFLIYPVPILKPIDIKAGDIEVKSLIFDISRDIEEAGKDFLNNLFNFFG